MLPWEHGGRPTIDTVFGNLGGLKSLQVKKLSYLYRRRLTPGALLSRELARELAELSGELHREISLLLDRRGRVSRVSVCDAFEVEIPDRSDRQRLAGLTLLHSHPRRGKLSRADLSTLFLKRLDAIVAVEVAGDQPGVVHLAQLTPPGSNADEEDWRIYPPMSVLEAEQFDLGGRLRALEQELVARKLTRGGSGSGSSARAVLLQPEHRGEGEERLAELAELARTAGAEVVGSQLAELRDRSSAFGRGRLEELTSLAYHQDADLLIVGQDLSPTQARDLEEATRLRVLDRTQLILDIFAQHAQGKESQLQVELAQLRYLLPRLLGKGTALSRQGGGIGARGPGETKLEIDRRRINRRIAELQRQVDELSAQRGERRRGRSRSAEPVISIIGYTNAGKSTLLNALGHLGPQRAVLAENQLFATLRPTSRRGWLLGTGPVIYSDTVGFIQELPSPLRWAFQATLEEIASSDLLLHLVDVSSSGWAERLRAVRSILSQQGIPEKRELILFSKWDAREGGQVAGSWEDTLTHFQALPVSMKDPASLDAVRAAISAALQDKDPDLGAGANQVSSTRWW